MSVRARLEIGPHDCIDQLLELRAAKGGRHVPSLGRAHMELQSQLTAQALDRRDAQVESPAKAPDRALVANGRDRELARGASAALNGLEQHLLIGTGHTFSSSSQPAPQRHPPIEFEEYIPYY